MRDWQKNLVIIFCPLLILAFFLVEEKKKEEVSHKVSRTIASLPSGKVPGQNIPKKRSRKIATERSISKKYHSLLKRIPQSIEETFRKNTEAKITRGYTLLENVAALPEKEFNPSYGSVIQKSEGLVFFRANPSHRFIPVALSKSTSILYPLSTVIHVKGATPEIRNELLSKGYSEYYYHPPLKLLSLQTNKGDLLKIYNRLTKAGHKVELEVLKPGPQTF